MQTPDTHDAPLVPYTPDTATQAVSTDGGSRREPERTFDRPPTTDHATEYAHCSEEIEPFVADLR